MNATVKSTGLSYLVNLRFFLSINTAATMSMMPSRLIAITMKQCLSSYAFSLSGPSG